MHGMCNRAQSFWFKWKSRKLEDRESFPSNCTRISPSKGEEWMGLMPLNEEVQEEFNEAMVASKSMLIRAIAIFRGCICLGDSWRESRWSLTVEQGSTAILGCNVNQNSFRSTSYVWCIICNKLITNLSSLSGLHIEYTPSMKNYIIAKELIKESNRPCVVLILLVPKKYCAF